MLLWDLFISVILAGKRIFCSSTAGEGRQESERHCCPVIFLSACIKLKLHYPGGVSPVTEEIGNDGHCHCG